MTMRSLLLWPLLMATWGPSASSVDDAGGVHELVSALRSSVGAFNVFDRQSPEYNRRRIVHNGLCRHRYPDVVVTPRTTAHVSVVVQLATSMGFELSVRSGGHSFICNNIRNGGVHLDMRRMNRVQFKGGDHALIGPGNTWGRVLTFIPSDQFTVVHGQCLSVGVAGYLLGGGAHVHGISDLYGFGSLNVLQYTMVTAAGEVALVTANNVTLLDQQTQELRVVEQGNELFKALGAAGSSYGIVTEFKYKVHPTPEPQSALLYIFVESDKDLDKLQRLYENRDYHVCMYAVYLFNKHGYSKEVLERHAGVMSVPWAFRKWHGRASEPVIVTLMDRSSPFKADYNKAVQFVKRFGLKVAFERAGLFQKVIPASFDVFDYEHWYMSDEEIKKKGYQAVVSANFGSDSMRNLAWFLVHHPVFGMRHRQSSKARRAGCDFCYFVIHSNYRKHTPNVEHFLHVVTSRLQLELTCTYEPYRNRACPRVLRNLKKAFNAHSRRLGEVAKQYPNTPSCDASRDFGQRYYGPNYHLMVDIKRRWDPNNVFNHCQSVGSNNTDCCPQEYNYNDYNL